MRRSTANFIYSISIEHGIALRIPCVAVVGSIGQQRLARTDRSIHVNRQAPVIRLAFGQFQPDWATEGIDQHMYLGGNPAARTA